MYTEYRVRFCLKLIKKSCSKYIIIKQTKLQTSVSRKYDLNFERKIYINHLK